MLEVAMHEESSGTKVGCAARRVVWITLLCAVFASILTLADQEQAGAQSAPRAVRLEGSSETFVLYGSNNTRQWVSPTCRTQLSSAGVNFPGVKWNVISPNRQTTVKTCDRIQFDVTGRWPGARMVAVAGSSNGDAFIVLPWDRRVWVSPGCRKEIQVVTGTTSTMEWNELSRRTEKSGYDCDQQHRLLGKSPYSYWPSTQRPYQLAGSADGWIVDNNRRYWVSDDCKKEMNTLGVSFKTTSWDVIAQKDEYTRNCYDLINRLFPGSAGRWEGRISAPRDAADDVEVVFASAYKNLPTKVCARRTNGSYAKIKIQIDNTAGKSVTASRTYSSSSKPEWFCTTIGGTIKRVYVRNCNLACGTRKAVYL